MATVEQQFAALPTESRDAAAAIVLGAVMAEDTVAGLVAAGIPWALIFQLVRMLLEWLETIVNEGPDVNPV